jgi:hypothetical protein
MRLAYIQVRRHLPTDMTLPTAPSHVVSAGGVSFTVSAGSPQLPASIWKYAGLIWSFIARLKFLFGLPTGSAAHAYKGQARQRQCHTLLHTHDFKYI